jgi:hypothetical protein
MEIPTGARAFRAVMAAGASGFQPGRTLNPPPGDESGKFETPCKRTQSAYRIARK